MSTQQPGPTTPEPTPGSAPTEAPPSSTPSPEADTPSSQGAKGDDPLRGSRTSGIWIAVVALILVVVLLAIFILQNTQTAQVSYFGRTGSAPVSALLLIAAAGGALLVASAGALRIMQLRRRVKKVRKRSR